MSSFNYSVLHELETRPVNPLTGRMRSSEHLQAIALRDDHLPMRSPAKIDALIKILNTHTHFTGEGLPGSGKSTQIPQIIMWQLVHEDTPGAVLIVQPRRLAAKTLADRLRFELDVSATDHIVVVRMRDGESKSKSARIVVATDGMALRDIIADPEMPTFRCVLLDEVHEQGINLELLLGFAKQMIYNQVNPTLRWGFLSATSDFTTLRSWLGLDDSASFVLEPLKHDVTIVYQEKAEWNYVNWVLRSIIDYTKTHPVGHIMVFAPGKREVDTIAEAIRKNPAITNKKVYAVYADQDESSRNSVIESVPEGTRKIAVGTNVLETSITIPGLQLVIDTCYQKTASFNPVAIHRRLMLCLVSAAQADQRAGRTGRVGAGIVMRGCTEQYFEDVIKKHRYPAPKISAQEYTSALLSNLALVDRLNLATDGKFGDLKTIDTPSQPPFMHQVIAISNLRAMGAVEYTQQCMQITEVGRSMSAFSIEPHFARSLIAAVHLGCAFEMAELVAACSPTHSILAPQDPKVADPDAILRQATLHVPFSDHHCAFNAWRAWKHNGHSFEFAAKHNLRYSSLEEAKNTLIVLVGQLEEYCLKVNLDPVTTLKRDPEGPNIDLMLRALTFGHLHQIATGFLSGLDEDLFPVKPIDDAHNEEKRIKRERDISGTHIRWHDRQEGLIADERSVIGNSAQFSAILYSEASAVPGTDETVIKMLAPVKIEWIEAACQVLKQTH